MTFTPGQRVSSFLVTNVRRSDELKADIVELVHEKTGCPVFWLNNGCENKVFSITFRTLPEDDTGVFHILEHSVLCGSDLYPVKEPFVELLKGSMNTFLNAMTFPDMTMYPVSSRNDQDLLNLTGVYLDAVFCPRALHDERIFRQEGWHIEKNEDGQYVYNGVVFNEMKGAMSDADGLAERYINRQLFPDNGYGWNSGGDPESIPSLTWEKYKEQYLRHYHPSNARIYLDGAVPIDRLLPLIASWLDRYDKLPPIPDTHLQTPVSSDETIFWELGQDEDETDRGQLYVTRILGSWRDRTENMAVSLIGDVLTGSNDAPLKRLVLEKGLAQDITLSIDDTCLQSFLIIQAENVADGREEELLSLIRGYGNELAASGLDRGALEASLNRMVFTLKEEDEPQGIGRAIHAASSWIYGADPLRALENDPHIAELREMISSGALDQLALRLFRNQEGTCVLRLHPSKTLGEEKRREEEARLAAATGAWSDSDRRANEALVESLKSWQLTPDSPEALATLPMLRKEDAEAEPEWTETEETSVDGIRLLSHSLPCGGIVYLRAVFSLGDLSAEELARANMISRLMGRLPTANHNVLSLQQDIRRYTGSLTFYVNVRPHPDDPSLCAPSLVASASVLRENVEKAESLLTEILLTTDFSAADYILEIVQQTELLARQRVITSGQHIGIRNVLSHYSAEFAAKNILDGDEAMAYIHGFARNPEEYLFPLAETAARLVSRNFCRENMILTLTSDKPISWSPLISALPHGQSVPEYTSFVNDAPPRRGFRIPAQIGYAVRGCRLSEIRENSPGIYYLAAAILSLSYLWNKVRVQGGAYGSGFQIDRNGNMYSYSYRDPTPGRTLTVDAGMSAFLREFLEGSESLDKYIISTLNELNPLLSSREKGALADSRYLCGYTHEQFLRIRRDILNAGPEDLLRCSSALDEFASSGAVCVVAHAEALSQCPGLEITDL